MNRTTIASKIFGLAVFLLLLTIGLATYLIFESRKTEREIQAVARTHLPLAEAMTEINESGLRRRLAFERWFGALNAPIPNAEIIAEASANYAAYDQKLKQAFTATRAVLNALPPEMISREKVTELGSSLTTIEAAYVPISNRQRQVLDLQRAGEQLQANQLLNVLNDLQSSVQAQREAIRIKVMQATMQAADNVSDRQHTMLWLTIAATLSTVLLGLLIATVITKRLTNPVRSLVSALQEARNGNLERTLDVTSADELGTLTESFNYFVMELRAKEKIKRVFGRYIDQRVIDQVLLEPEEANVSGERRVMTVLFADLVGFTGLSERLTPSVMVAVLNRHFGLQAQAVHEHRGVVDKFIGDAIMAFWGVPFVKESEHAGLACQTALAQAEALVFLRRELPQISGLRTGAPPIDLRIGVCTGEVVVGNIGSETTRSFTAIGDTVNLASRIEGVNRVYGTQILISDTTAAEIGASFELREIDTIAVKGKSETVRIYELLGMVGNVDKGLLQLRDCYTQALSAYRQSDWTLAARLFGECVLNDVQDRAAQLMQQRTAFFQVNPPAPGWDGAWRLDEK
jgi:adenylate cyclase